MLKANNLTFVGKTLFEKDVNMSVISVLGPNRNDFVSSVNLDIESIILDELHGQLGNNKRMRFMQHMVYANVAHFGNSGTKFSIPDKGGTKSQP